MGGGRGDAEWDGAYAACFGSARWRDDRHGPIAHALFGIRVFVYDNFFGERPAAQRTEKIVGPLDASLEFRDFLASRGIELLLTFPPAKAALYPEYATNIPYAPEEDSHIDLEFRRFLRFLFRTLMAELGVPIHLVSTGDGSPTIGRRTIARAADKSHVKQLIGEIQTHLLPVASKWQSVRFTRRGEREFGEWIGSLAIF